MTTALFNNSIKNNKFEIIEKLKNSKIATRPFFDPLSSLKAYEKSKDTLRAQQANKNSYEISKRGINLPSAANLLMSDVTKIRNTIGKF